MGLLSALITPGRVIYITVDVTYGSTITLVSLERIDRKSENTSRFRFNRAEATVQLGGGEVNAPCPAGLYPFGGVGLVVHTPLSVRP